MPVLDNLSLFSSQRVQKGKNLWAFSVFLDMSRSFNYREKLQFNLKHELHKNTIKILSIEKPTIKKFKHTKKAFLFYFLKFLFSLYFTLQYYIGFAIHWHESATGVHEFPILNPFSPPTPYHLSGSSPCTSPKHPVSCIEHWLAIRFIYDSIHVSMPFSQVIVRRQPGLGLLILLWVTADSASVWVCLGAPQLGRFCSVSCFPPRPADWLGKYFWRSRWRERQSVEAWNSHIHQWIVDLLEKCKLIRKRMVVIMMNWCFPIVVLEKTLESPLDCNIKPVNSKGNQLWIFFGRMLLKLKLQYFGHLMQKTNSLEETPMLGKTEGRGGEGEDGRWDGWMASPTR